MCFAERSVGSKEDSQLFPAKGSALRSTIPSGTKPCGEGFFPLGHSSFLLKIGRILSRGEELSDSARVRPTLTGRNPFQRIDCFTQCGFGSVRFRFLVFAIGPVRFMFGFGSCGSWSISVRFGSVFGTFCIDICFFSGVGKANTDCFPQLVSWAAAFKERRELNSANQSFLILSMHVIYSPGICFFHWTQKAITTCPISLLGEPQELIDL